jgi:type IV secretion system protein VirB2
MYQLQAMLHYQWMSFATKDNTRKMLQVTAFLLVGLALAIVAPDAFASTAAAMPWEGPICAVAKSLSGPTAKAVAVIAVVISGLMLAFGELGGIFKTFMGLLMGIAMAIMATQWVGFIDGTTTAICTTTSTS